MTRLLAACVAALALCGAASADTFVPASPFSTVPSADTPNVADTTGFPVALSTPPAEPQQLSFDELLPIWQAAGQQYGIPWTVLAAINKVESDFGRNMGPSSAGAVGWMQFMPSTWERWGTDADGDGVADPWTATDAIYSAARYLAAAGGQTDISRGVFAYNHAQWYVDEVLQLAQVYAGGGSEVVQSLDDLQARVDAAQQAVLEANGKLLAAEQVARKLDARWNLLVAKAQAARTLTGRLNAQKAAVIFQGQVLDAHAEVDRLRADLEAAQAELDAARQATTGAAFSPATADLVGAPAYSNGYVFPVGGGAGVVSVGHTHHDYPAADIAAPEGSPLYALSNGTVSWVATDAASGGNCGIGFTIGTTDGLSWTYCHAAYLEPAVAVGAQLTAGQPVGLVGQTGHAEGPHLHLQLHPATGYPQEEPWFQSFAGTAFTWSDSVQSAAARPTIFALVGESPEPVAEHVTRVTSSAAPAEDGGGVVLFSTG
jgi:murein DD-endopeptidase MepM/ murein hydrolase activator NlpD